MTEHDVTEHDVDSRYPWIAMGVVLIGTFMVILDTTIVNVALPQIGIALGRSDGIEWVVTAYLLAVGVSQPATGWLADRFGRKQVFIVSLALFGIGSLLAALSPSLEVLVAFRVLQGLGGGALMPVGMAMIYELFPPDQRGTALGVWGVAAMAGPAFGPVIGGYLVTAVSWHWLFLVNVPIGVVGVIAAMRLLRDTGFRERRPFDATGLGLATVGLVLLLFAFSRANDWGWSSTRTVGMLGAAVVLLVLFVLRELRTEHPALEVRMFKVGTFSLTMVIIWAVIAVQFGGLVFLPLELETLRHFTALKVGTLLVPTAVAAAITFPIGGRITDRIGPRLPVTVGAALLAVSAWYIAQLDADLEPLGHRDPARRPGARHGARDDAEHGRRHERAAAALRGAGDRGPLAEPAGGGVLRGGAARDGRRDEDGRGVRRGSGRHRRPDRAGRLQHGVPDRCGHGRRRRRAGAVPPRPDEDPRGPGRARRRARGTAGRDDGLSRGARPAWALPRRAQEP